jgi:ABC-type nitrate/sulfonate/bicarbonate transport system ATPase subunit
MTDGPEARVGEIYEVPFPRPRNRNDVMDDPNYFNAHTHVIDFLENYAKQFAA